MIDCTNSDELHQCTKGLERGYNENKDLKQPLPKWSALLSRGTNKMQECSVGFTTSRPQVRQSQSILDVHLEDTDLPVLWSLTGRQCTGTTKPVNDHLEQSYSEEVRTRKEFNFSLKMKMVGTEGQITE